MQGGCGGRGEGPREEEGERMRAKEREWETGRGLREEKRDKNESAGGVEGLREEEGERMSAVTVSYSELQ